MDTIANFHDEAIELYKKHIKPNHSFMQNEYFITLFIKKHGIIISNCDFPMDYSNSRNGLSRFNVDYVTPENTSTINQLY